MAAVSGNDARLQCRAGQVHSSAQGVACILGTVMVGGTPAMDAPCRRSSPCARSFSTGLRKSCRASQMREVSVLARNIDEAEIRSRDPDHRRSPICGSRMEGLLAKIICCKIGFFMPMNWSFGDTEPPEIPARSVLFYSEGCSGIIASRDVGLDTTAASTQSEDYACLIHFLIQI